MRKSLYEFIGYANEEKKKKIEKEVKNDKKYDWFWQRKAHF